MSTSPSLLDPPEIEGILLVDKPRGKTSFNIVSLLRKRLNVQKIGHAGTLDPFATGVLVMLVGKNYTRRSDQFLCADKEYFAEVHLGISTDTYDCDGTIVSSSDKVPTLDELKNALDSFQGKIQQIPPMFSAKKINGKKLYELARKGETIERQPATIEVTVRLVSYTYPFAILHIKCSKGTYIRSIAQDLGNLLGCGAHVTQLQRIRSGSFHLQECISGQLLELPETDIISLLKPL